MMFSSTHPIHNNSGNNRVNKSIEFGIVVTFAEIKVFADFALESDSPNGLRLASVAFLIIMQDIFGDFILDFEEIIPHELLFFEATLAHIVIRPNSTLESLRFPFRH